MKIYILFLLVNMSPNGTLSYWRESGEFTSKNNCVVAGKTLTERDYQPSTQKYQCLEK